MSVPCAQRRSATLLLLLSGIGLVVGCTSGPAPAPAAPDAPARVAPGADHPAAPSATGAGTPGGFDLERLGHIVVIYQENWSFDGLYSQFPGAEGVAIGSAVVQTDAQGHPLTSLPQVDAVGRGQPYASGRAGVRDPRFPASLPVQVFNLLTYVPPAEKTGDLIHAFYTEQAQIHGGANDRFVAGSTNPGLVLGVYDGTSLPEGRLAQDFVLCDHCFHSAFGGSFLNHQWMIAAATPPWTGSAPAPAAWRSVDGADVDQLQDGPVSTDGQWLVNTVQTRNPPHGPGPMIPALFTHPTIGDRLSAGGISWAWYAGGWDDALATGVVYQAPAMFQAHHQPFNYFAAFDVTTENGRANRISHLKDEADFLAAVKDGSLPKVCFIKPTGKENEHPGYTDLMNGQSHVAGLVQAIQASPVWADCAIIITYDEHGGRWDHVAPPVVDRWGPGVRVPMVIISPFARRHVVDHTPCESVSVLALIEHRWHLPALSTRDAAASDLVTAFSATP